MEILLPLLEVALAQGGNLLVFALVLPVLALLLAFPLGGPWAGRVALASLALGLGVAVAIVAAVLHGGAALSYNLGGWAPPLGVALKADGLSATMLLVTPVILGAVGLYAWPEFRVPPGTRETRVPLAFWSLLLGVWAGLNAVFLGQDLFNLYVALELVTFSAVPLVCLSGRPETLAAALRYLLFALLGSVLYVLGSALLYGAYGTLDIALLSARLTADLASGEPAGPVVLVAVALMTVGLLAKTALFPLHFWLPPAHAGAPPAASAVLSALVVKASFFLILRLWLDVLPAPLTQQAAPLLAALGVAAILFGGAQALRQARLKMLIAYSTVAQIGYLFLVFPLTLGSAAAPAGPEAAGALTGGMLQLIAHAFAKASMFMGAGVIAAALGHDQIRNLGGIARALPITILAFVVASLSLVGLEPSGGYAAKTLLTAAADASGQWWWALALNAGGLLTATYLLWVLFNALSGLSRPPTLLKPPRRHQELLVLGLALGALVLGLVPPAFFDLMQIGRQGVTEVVYGVGLR
ncbi:MAG: NADH-quinone oxidoreductase subunit J [Chromatiaceae bacterium]|nr:NADH-quinone oxidoreductase subunit J [Chromatiaceae bacterium]